MIPTLYRSALVIERLDSFFLHNDLLCLDNVSTLSSTDLVQLGHFKLAALRYLRRLIVGDPSWNFPDDDEDMQMGDRQKIMLHKARSRQLRGWRITALQQLESLPTNAMPLLASVSIGSVDYHRQDIGNDDGDIWKIRRRAAMSTGLLDRAAVTDWCQRPTPTMPIELPLQYLCQRARDNPTSLPALYVHCQYTDDFRVIPGGLTYVYIHEDYRDSTPVREPHIERRNVGEWIGYNIMRSLSDANIVSGTEECKRVIEDTVIVVAGAVIEDRILPVCPESEFTESASPESEYGSDEEVREDAKHRISAIADFLIGMEDPTYSRRSDLQALRIYIRQPAHMPRCPVCKLQV